MKINLAKEFAKQVHSGQKDDEGKDYFIHLEQVVNILKQTTTDENILCAGYLHDTIEDGNVLYSELNERFGEQIANLVYEITHDDYGGQGHTFPRLKSREAIMIKFADRLSNISRMNSWDKERQEHYLRRSKFWKSNLNDKIIEGQRR